MKRRERKPAEVKAVEDIIAKFPFHVCAGVMATMGWTYVVINRPYGGDRQR